MLPLAHPQVMGILNITPDSFSDGGRFGAAGTDLGLVRDLVLVTLGVEVNGVEEASKIRPQRGKQWVSSWKREIAGRYRTRSRKNPRTGNPVPVKVMHEPHCVVELHPTARVGLRSRR